MRLDFPSTHALLLYFVRFSLNVREAKTAEAAGDGLYRQPEQRALKRSARPLLFPIQGHVHRTI